MRKTDDAWVLLSPTDVGHLKVRGLPRQHVQAHMERRGSSPLWGADYEGWPQGNRHGLLSPKAIWPAAMGAATVDRAAVGDAAKRDRAG